jgi:2-oxoglutarate dehydrogenase E1 component
LDPVKDLEMKVNSFLIVGLNSTICGLAEIMKGAAKSGCEFVVLGMAHRGRLSILHCILDKPAEIMLQEFIEHKKHHS